MLFRTLADKQRMVFLSHDIAIKTLHDDAALISGMNNAVVAIVQLDIITYAYVAFAISRHAFVERAPCAQVAPPEVGGEHVYFLGFLHHGVVDTYAGAVGEAAVDGFLFLFGAVNFLQALKDF